MTHVIANLVEQTSLSSGLTTITLSGAAQSPKRNFSAVCSNGDTVEAMVVDQATGAWQNAIYSYADNVLTFVGLLSSSTGAQVNFAAGYKRVYIAPNAERAGHDVVIKPASGISAAHFQAALESAVNANIPFQVKAGTVLADAIEAYGQLPANDVLLGYASGGGGKTLVMRGAHKWLSIIQGAYIADILFRFRGGTYPITGRISMSDIAFHVGSMTTTKPLVSITGNAQVDLHRVLTRGKYDLSAGGGFGSTGQFTGSLIDCEVINSSGPGMNFGAGLDAGTPLSEGNHPTDFWIIRPRVRNHTSHGVNGTHSVEGGGILEPNIVHDTARLHYRKSNAGLRAGNGTKGLLWRGGRVKGPFRGGQANDPDGATFEGTAFEQCGGPGFVLGAKNNGKAGNVTLKNQRFKNIARLRGWPKPEADADDEETDTRSIDQEAAAYVVTGCEGVDISGAVIENDYRPEWYGLLTIAAGGTTGTIVDSANQGSQLGTGLSGNFPGDIVYQNDSDEFPSFNFRIARNGISSRVYKTATDGSGVTQETVAYGAEPPARVNATYLAASIVSITKGNPTLVTVTGDPNFKSGDVMFLHGGDMTQINNQWLTATKIDLNNFTLPIDSTSFTTYTGGGTAQRGCGSTVTTVTPDAPAMAAVTNGVYRMREMKEKFVLTGVCSPADDPSVIEQKTITGITKANPGKVTVVGHGYTTGQIIAITDITTGMTEVNDRAFTITAVDADNYTIGIDTSSYTTWTSGGKSNKGVAEGTWEWKSLEEPTYFAPGKAGSTITVSTSIATVSSTGSPQFLTWIKPYLDDLSKVTLYGSHDATLTGIKVALGVASSVGSNSALTLTANGLRNYTGPFWYGIENKAPFGAIIGDRTTAENRARNVTYQAKSEIGATLASCRIYPGTMKYDDLPQHRAVIPAQTITTTAGVDVFVSTCVNRKRQRMDDVRLTFSDAIAGHATNHLKARVIKERGATRTVVTGMDVAITQTARAAGYTLIIPAPTMDGSGNIAAADLFDSRQDDKVILNIYAVNSGGAMPTAAMALPQPGW